MGVIGCILINWAWFSPWRKWGELHCSRGFSWFFARNSRLRRPILLKFIKYHPMQQKRTVGGMPSLYSGSSRFSYRTRIWDFGSIFVSDAWFEGIERFCRLRWVPWAVWHHSGSLQLCFDSSGDRLLLHSANFKHSEPPDHTMWNSLMSSKWDGLWTCAWISNF